MRTWLPPFPAFPSVAVSNTTTRGALVGGGPQFARVNPSRPGTPKHARGQPNLATTVFSQWAANSERIAPVRSPDPPGSPTGRGPTRTDNTGGFVNPNWDR